MGDVFKDTINQHNHNKHEHKDLLKIQRERTMVLNSSQNKYPEKKLPFHVILVHMLQYGSTATDAIDAIKATN